MVIIERVCRFDTSTVTTACNKQTNQAPTLYCEIRIMKIAQASRLLVLVTVKIRLPKVKYYKFVQKKIRYCLGISQFTISLLITCILAEEIDYEIGHFRIFQTSVTLTLTLDHVIRHTVGYHSSTCIYIRNYVEIRKNILALLGQI